METFPELDFLFTLLTEIKINAFTQIISECSKLLDTDISSFMVIKEKNREDGEPVWANLNN